MTDFTGIAHRYIDVWNETDPAKRRARVEGLFAAGATYTDPLGAVAGHGGVDGSSPAHRNSSPDCDSRSAELWTGITTSHGSSGIRSLWSRRRTTGSRRPDTVRVSGSSPLCPYPLRGA